MNSPSPIVTRCTPADLYAVLSEQAVPGVREALERAGPGQRLRITSLPQSVMEQLCAALQNDDRWVTRILVSGTPSHPWETTATKAIELRNRLVEPLLVLVPPELRTVAEDSLDIATFTELSFTELNRAVAEALLAQLPDELRVKVDDALSYLRLQKIVRNADQEVDYLLTVARSGCTSAVAGASLFVFGLIPDYELFNQTSVRFWLSRNERVRAELADIRRPLQERISQLPLKPDTIQKDIFFFLRERHTEDSTSWAAAIAGSPNFQHLSLNNWPFNDSTEETELRLIVDPLNLPLQKPDEVGGAADANPRS